MAQTETGQQRTTFRCEVCDTRKSLAFPDNRHLPASDYTVCSDCGERRWHHRVRGAPIFVSDHDQE